VVTYILIPRQDLPNITTRVFVQFLVVAKDYNRDIDRAENGKLMRLLEKTSFALEESPVALHVSDSAKMKALRIWR
jgi:hypothetical protein